MVDSVPTLTDMLQGLENSPPPPQTSEEKSKRKYQGLTDAEKLAQAVSWQQQGIPVSAIAKIFEVTPRTIHKWLSKAKAEFRETFEGETAADNLAGHLMFLRNIQETCLYEAHMASSDSKEFDPKTGQVSDNRDKSSRGIKAKYLDMAAKARKMEIDLLVTTGVLPTEPGRMYHSLEDEGRLESEAENTAVAKATRNRDQLVKDLIDKLERSSTL